MKKKEAIQWNSCANKARFLDQGQNVQSSHQVSKPGPDLCSQDEINRDGTWPSQNGEKSAAVKPRFAAVWRQLCGESSPV